MSRYNEELEYMIITRTDEIIEEGGEDYRALVELVNTKVNGEPFIDVLNSILGIDLQIEDSGGDENAFLGFS